MLQPKNNQILKMSLVIAFISFFVEANSMDQSGNISMTQKLKDLESGMKETMERLIESMLRQSGTLNLNVETECRKDLMRLMIGLRKLESWALKFIDSTAKGFDGVMTSSTSFLGSFDECLDIMVPRHGNRKGALFRGQYCLVSISPDIQSEQEAKEMINYIANHSRMLKDFEQSLKIVIAANNSRINTLKIGDFRLGICLPSGCRPKDVEYLVSKMTKPYSLDGSVITCSTKEKIPFSPIQVFAICCFAGVGLLTIVGTLLDVISKWKGNSYKSIGCRILLQFSFIANCAKLMSTSREPGKLTCLDGMRFVTMTWVILVHVVVFYSIMALQRPLKLLDFFKRFTYQPINNSCLAVDTFFCVGGFLLCYTFLRKAKHKVCLFEIFENIVRRLCRIYPAYIFFILFSFIMPHLGSGPLWKVFTNTTNCEKYWWRSLLFINNVDANSQCFFHIWYLAVDFQVHVICLFISYIILRSEIVGLCLIVSGIIASIVFSGVVAYLRNSIPAFIYTLPYHSASNDVVYYYQSTLSHLGAYFIGYLVGYCFVKNPDVKIPKKLQIIGWGVAVAAGFSVVYGLKEWTIETYPSALQLTAYSALHRTVWSACISWVIFCCATGHARIVNQFLSWTVLDIIGRLTFCAYLLHALFCQAVAGQLRTQTAASNFMIVSTFLSVLVMTYMAAFGFSVLIEIPFSSLQNILMPKKDAKKRENEIVLGTKTFDIATNGHKLPSNTASNAVS